METVFKKFVSKKRRCESDPSDMSVEARRIKNIEKNRPARAVSVLMKKKKKVCRIYRLKSISIFVMSGSPLFQTNQTQYYYKGNTRKAFEIILLC